MDHGSGAVGRAPLVPILLTGVIVRGWEVAVVAVLLTGGEFGVHHHRMRVVHLRREEGTHRPPHHFIYTINALPVKP